ncbi:MAG TPA: DUF2948 family protein [Alphaproteobacteria bacterium]|nr:DUF2948 family protein [Alphaproteobacteria bacterium]
MVQRLKLRGEDEEDLRTISAILQDALVPVADMAYLPRERRFVLVANRFRWEAEPEPPIVADEGEEAPPGPVFERVLTGLCFEGVRSARLRNIDRRRSGQILELLHLGWEPGCLTLTFAGGGAIRLEAERISCRLDDICEPWPTLSRPRHEIETDETQAGGGR